MSQKFYVDSEGKYIRSQDGGIPPVGGIAVPVPPPDGRYVWDGAQWKYPPELAEKIVDEKRVIAYDKAGVTIEAMIVALWEYAVEGKPTATDELQAKREQVKIEHPKPQ